MKWWEKLYSSEDYLMMFSRYATDEITRRQIDFVLAHMPLTFKHKILDLCCGAGRHCLELARRSYQVVGLDWSMRFLTIASDLAAAQELPVAFVKGDMRNIPFKEDFDVVLNMFTSFGYFEDDEENEEVIHQISKVLKPHGFLFFDFISIEPLVQRLAPVIWHHDIVTGATIIRERFLDTFSWRLNEECTLIEGNQIQNMYNISYRVYTLAEFRAMLHRHNLEFIRAFGDFDGRNAYENSPPRMIVIARKSQNRCQVPNL